MESPKLCPYSLKLAGLYAVNLPIRGERFSDRIRSGLATCFGLTVKLTPIFGVVFAGKIDVSLKSGFDIKYREAKNV
jgi:hypothetical protein